MTISDALEKMGGRKFALTLLAFSTATAIELLTERGITEAYTALLIGLVGVYGASNVAITRKGIDAETASSNAEAATAEPSSSPDIEIQLAQIASEQEAMKATIDAMAQNVSMTSQLLAAAASGQMKR